MSFPVHLDSDTSLCRAVRVRVYLFSSPFFAMILIGIDSRSCLDGASHSTSNNNNNDDDDDRGDPIRVEQYNVDD